ncbi:MAG: hypothetical protein QMC36_00935, partial [Patescibacteria group bacterium]
MLFAAFFLLLEVFLGAFELAFGLHGGELFRFLDASALLEDAGTALEFDFDRSSGETEVFADAVFEVARVAEVEVARVVDRDDEARRLDVDLGSVVDLRLVRLAVARRRVLEGDLFEEFVEHGGLD